MRFKLLIVADLESIMMIHLNATWRQGDRRLGLFHFVLLRPEDQDSRRGDVNLVEQRIYPAPIEWRFDIDLLADLSEEEADAGEEDGLQGKKQYRDMRGITWEQLAEALQREAELF